MDQRTTYRSIGRIVALRLLAKRLKGSIRSYIVGFLKIKPLFLLFTKECRFFAIQFMYKLKVLSRKVEGLDPVKP